MFLSVSQTAELKSSRRSSRQKRRMRLYRMRWSVWRIIAWSWTSRLLLWARLIPASGAPTSWSETQRRPVSDFIKLCLHKCMWDPYELLTTVSPPSYPSANMARSRLNEAHLKAERLFDRLKPLQTLGENLSRNLSEIKELINQARKQAASVSLASRDSE